MLPRNQPHSRDGSRAPRRRAPRAAPGGPSRLALPRPGPRRECHRIAAPTSHSSTPSSNGVTDADRRRPHPAFEILAYLAPELKFESTSLQRRIRCELRCKVQRRRGVRVEQARPYWSRQTSLQIAHCSPGSRIRAARLCPFCKKQRRILHLIHRSARSIGMFQATLSVSLAAYIASRPPTMNDRAADEDQIEDPIRMSLTGACDLSAAARAREAACATKPGAWVTARRGRTCDDGRSQEARRPAGICAD